MSIDLLYEDEHLFAVFKPPWLLVHRGMGRDEDTLVDRVRAWQGGGKVHPLHRLDRQTSGVVLFAKTPEAARAAREVFDAGNVRKTYLAMVRGIAPDSGFIDYAIPRSEGGERVDAQTHFRRLSSASISPRAVSIVEAQPVTGRFHQLRRHLRHIHHPILLDSNYGPTKLNRAFKAEWNLPRLTLHALRVELEHPLMAQASLCIESKLPDDLSGPWQEMGVWPPELDSDA